MIPKGAYAAVVAPMATDFGELACQFGHSSEKNTPQVLVTFEILRGPEAGQRISWFGFFTDKTSDRTLQSLRICGFTGDDIDKFWEQRPTNEVQIVVEHEDYKGKPRARIAWINDPNRAGVRMEKPMQAADMRKFSAQFKSKLKSMPAVKTTEAVKEAPTARTSEPVDDGWRGNDEPDPPRANEYAPPASDDDIPF